MHICKSVSFHYKCLHGACSPQWLCLAVCAVVLPCTAFLTDRQNLAVLTVVTLDIPHMMSALPVHPWWSPPLEGQQDRPCCGAPKCLRSQVRMLGWPTDTASVSWDSRRMTKPNSQSTCSYFPHHSGYQAGHLLQQSQAGGLGQLCLNCDSCLG